MLLRSSVAELRRLVAEADESDDDTEQLYEEAAPVAEVTKHYPMTHKNSLGPGPKGRKFGGSETRFMWHCKCPGGNCRCDRQSPTTGKKVSKSWTVNKERKAKYDRMYKAWRAKKERKGKYAKTDKDVRKAEPPTSPHVGSGN